ncbi:hypothetical protein GQ44DRAFT_775287 [Phaeosphaeriaceae sp. PMI808]|nr:hypothetical protein GQ44DRAFT_775287 [Phaeosphaeriaceae sp. PMI808]
MADGMFLLARLHTDSLSDKRTERDVKSALEKLLKGSAALDNAYDEALGRIKCQHEGDYELAKKVLSFVTFAKRPLTTFEICHALAVRPEDTEFVPEGIPSAKDLVTVCAGLVVQHGNKYIPNAQLEIASKCLTYLSFSEFKTGSRATYRKLRKRQGANQFLGYAARHWGDHVTTVEEDVCELACSFLADSGSASCAAQMSDAYMGFYVNLNLQRSTGLHLATQFELPIILEKLLSGLGKETTIIVNNKDSHGKTPLFYAASCNSHKMAKLLIDAGANAYAIRTALSKASLHGHEGVVKLLLSARVDDQAMSQLPYSDSPLNSG